jgi:hypothetical protein
MRLFVGIAIIVIGCCGPAKAQQTKAQQTLEESCRAWGSDVMKYLSNPHAPETAKQFLIENYRSKCQIPQRAPQQQEELPISAGDFLPACKAAVNREPGKLFAAGACYGLIKGISEVAGLIAPQNKAYCLPPGVTYEQVGRVFVAYLETHPARLHEDAVVLAVESFKNAWPCR